MSITLGNVPLHHSIRLNLQGVEVVEIAGNIVLGILAVIGQSSEQVNFVADQSEAVSQSRTGRWTILGVLGSQLLPLPARGLELVQIVAVLAVLHHASEHQDPRPVHHEPKGSTSWWDVSLDWGHEPLIGGCNDIIKL